MNALERKLRWPERALLCAVCAGVVAAYTLLARPGVWESLGQAPAEANYNLLLAGFRAGQLNLKKEMPAEFQQLTNPYDPSANARYRALPYRLHDLSYYKGKLYLYFGVTPVLILFWPFAALTGRYLFHSQAVLVFCATGFVVSVGLLCALWRRYFAEVGAGVIATCVVALGLATGVPVMLSRCDINEVAISCAYMLTMMALAIVWSALHNPCHRLGWLAVASLLYGLAVGARASSLAGAVILLLPVIRARREQKSRVLLSLVAAVGPIMFFGLGLMLYNFLRFDNPFELGEHYQLAPDVQASRHLFSPHSFWFNFRVYFLEPVRWSARFPFVRDIAVPPLPEGYGLVESPFGVLTNVPFAWLALAVPLAWRNRPAQAASDLRWFVVTLTALVALCVLTVGMFWSSIFRYQVDFLPWLVVLAVIGVLGLEHAHIDRLIARGGWILLLSVSVAFNFLASIHVGAHRQNALGANLALSGRPQEAIAHFEQALQINPEHADARYNLGIVLTELGWYDEALDQFQQALRIRPDYSPVHYWLGVLYAKMNRLDDAERQYLTALRYSPATPEKFFSLGLVWERQGKRAEAATAYRDALRVKPDFAAAHNNLANLLAEDGKLDEAIEHYRQALAAAPDLEDARRNLAAVQRRKQN